MSEQTITVQVAPAPPSDENIASISELTLLFFGASGAQQITVPASMRVAANASRFAAGIIFMHPYVRVGVGIASALGIAGLFWDPIERVWKYWDQRRELIDPGGEWKINGWGDAYYKTQQDACEAYVQSERDRTGRVHTIINTVGQCDFQYVWPFQGTFAGGARYSKREVSCPEGWEKTPAGCLSPQTGVPRKIETEEEFAQKILNPDEQPGWPTKPYWPFPDTVPSELPVPLPVEPPVINPNPQGEPKPLFVPSGDPVPNPNYDPNAAPSPQNQPWVRPGIQIVPSPTPDQPWRVDVQPVNVPQPTPNPADTPDPNGETKPEQKEDSDLCEKNPEILACAKPELDTPEGEIPKSERSVELDDTDLFGGGSCPADSYANIGGQHLKVWDWQQSCDYITRYLKPIILLLGAFSALMIVSGGTKE